MPAARGRAGALLIVVLATCAAAVAALLVPRVPQASAYHSFADQRAWIGIPNAANVLSSLPLVVIGVLGLAFLRRGEGSRGAFHDGRERLAWSVFFAAVLAVGLGSAFYHLRPDNGRLLWDRLPLAVVCVSLLDVAVAERVSPGAGRALLLPLVAIAAGSVGWWAFTESRGAGDLRPYGFVQFYPLLCMALLMLLLPARYTRTGDYLALIGWYAAAKAAELFDHEVFDATGWVSGHTLKHLLAFAAALQMLLMLRARRLVPPPAG